MNTLAHLEPSAVWKHFEDICAIPHPSKHEEQICAHICKFAQSQNLLYEQDSHGNIIIRKPAFPGKELCEPIVLQAHVDMVPQKNAATQHNFETDPIEPRIDGNWVRANNTTLGADNGIGLAVILAILESKTIEHGPLEALFTTDEETGMTGAFGLQPNKLKARYMINTDTEDEHDITIGCAGGIDGNFTYTFSRIPAHKNNYAYTITIEGLTGGHSGFEIFLNRANANTILADYLCKIHTKFAVQISSIQGGNMRNAIPREATALATVPLETHNEFLQYTKLYCNTLQELYKKTDPTLKMYISEHDLPQSIILSADTHTILHAISTCVNGVISFENNDISMPRTSTNLSIITSNDTQIEINCLLRSSRSDEKQILAQSMQAHFEAYRFKTYFSGDYPAWEPIWDSPIISYIQHAYAKLTSIHPKPTVVHAGLECGIIQNIYPHIEYVSFGPNIRGPHSPDERVEIRSVLQFWNILIDVLENIPQKEH